MIFSGTISVSSCIPTSAWSLSVSSLRSNSGRYPIPLKWSKLKLRTVSISRSIDSSGIASCFCSSLSIVMAMKHMRKCDFMRSCRWRYTGRALRNVLVVRNRCSISWWNERARSMSIALSSSDVP